MARSNDRRLKSRSDGIWLLVLVPILVIPFENHLTIAGLGLAKLTIIPLLVAVVVYRPKILIEKVRQPVFLLALAFLGWGALVEAFHPSSAWELLYRILQMLTFGALVGCVPSNTRIMRRTLLGLLFVSSLLALYLITNFYGRVNVNILSSVEADRARLEAFEDISLEANLNIIGYTVGMGAVVAFSRLLEAKNYVRRIVWGGGFVLCVIGATSTVSRGAFVAVASASCLMFWRSSKKSLTPQKLVFALVATLAIYALLPQTLTARLSSTADGARATDLAKEEARKRVYTAALQSIPEYWALGIGAGNYWHGWGLRHGFSTFSAMGKSTLGPHSGFFAAWIYFGLPGLVLLSLICFAVARQGPRSENTSWEATSLFGLMVLCLVWLAFTQDLYLKEFGLVLGLAMGTCWKTARPSAVFRRRGRMAERTTRRGKNAADPRQRCFIAPV